MTDSSAARARHERSLERLLPRPRRIVSEGGSFAIPRVLRLLARSAEPVHADALRFVARASELGFAIEIADCDPSQADVRIGIENGDARVVGAYRLRIGASGIDIAGADAAGVWYGLCTLEQLLRTSVTENGARGERGAERRLPCVAIDDAPDFEARGLMLDISRGTVPTLATLHAIIDLCARLKLNQLQLYVEHAFAYAGHERVWRDASPITPDEARELDRYARERHVELVPNQQSFGHMHRWLKHAPYRELAEVPEGFAHAFSREREPYGLCPIDERSLALLEDLYDQLLPCFSSALFDVGLDEPIDLGQGRSKEACARRGRSRVYLDFLLAVHERVRDRGRRMQFWADFVAEHPELAHELPRDVIALEWGYEADHPFAERTRALAESGLDFYVCPGTSSWQSIAGRTQNALANLRSAALNGRSAGARGYLVTDWGDRGHLQPLSASFLGIAAAAEFAWNATSADDLAIDWPALLDVHVLDGAVHGLGRAACDLGDAYLETGSSCVNGSALFFLLAFADEPAPHARTPGLSITGLQRALEYTLEKRASISATRADGARATIARDELAWAADLLAFAARLGTARLRAPSGAAIQGLGARERDELRGELDPLIAEQRRLWLARNRAGGIAESASWLTRIADMLTMRA